MKKNFIFLFFVCHHSSHYNKTNCSYIWTFCVMTASVDIQFPISDPFPQISGTKSLWSFPWVFGMFLLQKLQSKKMRRYVKSGDRKQELLFYNLMCEPLHVPLSGQVAQNWLNCQNCPNGDINKAPSSLRPQFA